MGLKTDALGAIGALRAGKKMRRGRWCNGAFIAMSTPDLILDESGECFEFEASDLLSTLTDWEEFEEPLTDEQLASAWETAAENIRCDTELGPHRMEMARAFAQCARQLRERKL